MFKILPVDRPKGLVLQLYSPDTDPESVHTHYDTSSIENVTGLKLCDKRHYLGLFY